MIKTVNISQIYSYPGIPVIDVRAPAEYSSGHIPNAINIPLFDDHERAQVGTRYHNSGKDSAFLLALDIAGPKMAGFIKKLHSVVPCHHPIIVYCWRGGMRSNSMGWLFSQAGHDVMIVEGGYKAFRNYIRQKTAKDWEYIIIGGLTGSGKTEIIRDLMNQGQQVIDLESLACHKGSVFGHLGQDDQPGNEWFEILIWEELRKFDHNKPVFIEDESRSIGKVSLPEPFFMKMQSSQVIFIETDIDSRIDRLVADYGIYPKEELITVADRLKKYLGGEIYSKVTESIRQGDLREAVRLLLVYYDKKYYESLVKYRDSKLIRSVVRFSDIRQCSNKILEECCTLS